jgi:hypothetical protein
MKWLIAALRPVAAQLLVVAATALAERLLAPRAPRPVEPLDGQHELPLVPANDNRP